MQKKYSRIKEFVLIIPERRKRTTEKDGSYIAFRTKCIVKSPSYGGGEIIPDGIVKFDADASSEIKFARIRVTEYFTAKLFHSAKQNFTCPQGQI